MSKKQSLIKKFVEENCLLFTLTIPTISNNFNFYVSFYNLNDENIKKLYDFFFEGEKDLFISQDDDELEDEKYLFLYFLELMIHIFHFLLLLHLNLE